MWINLGTSAHCRLTKKNKVVLFYPPYDGPPLGAPLSLLCLASPLMQAGFKVRIIDNLISPAYEEMILRETEDALCLGISMLTGPHIGAAIRVATKVKHLRPELPIVFGGWHPSLAVEQTLREPFVDAVVRTQGELTLLELAQRIAEGKTWHGVRGLSFKDGDQMIRASGLVRVRNACMSCFCLVRQERAEARRFECAARSCLCT